MTGMKRTDRPGAGAQRARAAACCMVDATAGQWDVFIAALGGDDAAAGLEAFSMWASAITRHQDPGDR